MPVSINHIYNLSDRTVDVFGLGKGWRTNFNQTVELSDNGTYYIWTDADGTRHNFNKKAGSNTTYVDEDGLRLTLTVSSGAYKITDIYGNTSNFDSYGRLISMVNNQTIKSGITITYNGTSKRIATIKDGAGRVYKFNYENNLLDTIGYHGTNGVNGAEITNVGFTYSSSKLVTITYADSEDKKPVDAHFTYSGSKLATATDVDGYKVAFTYSTGITKRVEATEDYYGGKSNNKITIEYAHGKAKISDSKDTVIKRYNDFGNLISTQDELGNEEFYQYAMNKYSDTSAYANQLKQVSKTQNTVTNLLNNGSFERFIDNVRDYEWSTATQANSKGVSEKAYMGSYALRVTLNSAVETVSACGMAIKVPGESSCTFSAYVQSIASTVQLGLGSQSVASVKSAPLSPGSEWNRLEVSYTNTSDKEVTIYPLLIQRDAGHAYVDCAQIEFTAGASRYNLVQNSDFRTDDCWSSNAILDTLADSAAPQLDANVCKVTGSPTGAQSIYQTVAVNGSAGDVFVVSGWAKGNSVPLNSSHQFGLMVMFINTDGSTSTEIIKFNSAYDMEGDWQYTAARLKAAKAYRSIVIQLIYFNNMNTVYFDGIQLYKEEFGERYEYDTNGNLTSVADVLGQTTTYGYSNNDLTRIVEASGLVTENSYSNHNLKTSKQYYIENGSKVNQAEYAYTYDNYGNLIETRSTVDNKIKKTSAEYTNAGNDLAFTIDELGNKTIYKYDPDTSVLVWVQYPKDTDATKTVYEYDAMYRLALTEATTDQGADMSVGYTYNESDLLAQVTTQSSVYNFAYNAYSLRERVSVGSRTLASYKYTNDIYHNLQSVTYGNLDKVEYIYDDNGRVKEAKCYENGNGTANRRITYTYDNSGALATMEEFPAKITTKYYYDNFGRSIGMYETGGSSNTHRLKYSYDEQGRLKSAVESYVNLNGKELSFATEYAYNGSGLIDEITAKNSAEKYTYDESGRLLEWYTYHGRSSASLITKSIDYKTTGSGTTSNLPSVWTYKVEGGNNYAYTYTYDANGNIISETVGGKTTTYVYDSANQLIRENNQAAGKTWVWTYDNAGNILSKLEYAYTTGTVGAVVKGIGYGYGDSNWKDLLTSYNGKTISYDANGNPLSDGKWTYTWQQGRKLAKMSNGSVTWIYAYDANGMRIRRAGGGSTYNYTYHGDQLTHMTYGSIALHFYYDANGNPFSVTQGGNTYYYVLNQQGDVVAILDSIGAQVVSYRYDAYGRLLATTGSMASTLGLHNPLRYRGYVYDRETGLYYLQSETST